MDSRRQLVAKNIIAQLSWRTRMQDVSHNAY